VINNYSVYEDGTVLFNTAQEALPSLCSADGPAIVKFDLDRLLERDERTGTPGKSYRKLRAFHWQGMPELPVYAADIPSPVLDILIAHDGRMQRDNSVGSFCGAPIVTLDEFGMEVDEVRNLSNRLAVSSGTSVPAEILPGEERCADGIIRRITTAEAVGYDVFKDGRPVEVDMGQRDCKASSITQSTAEGICAWLNAQPKSSFKSEVVTEGDDKIIRTTDAKGTLVYAFRYIGGLASDVIQCFDDGRGLQHPPIEIKEYADEWACTYIPTSHVERITVGGTALFAPEEEQCA
jgi:hypothetical protein